MVHTRARGALHLKMRPDFLLKVFKLLKLKKYKNLHIQRAWIIKAPKQRPSAVRFLSIQLVRILRFSSSKIINKILIKVVKNLECWSVRQFVAKNSD